MTLPTVPQFELLERIKCCFDVQETFDADEIDVAPQKMADLDALVAAGLASVYSPVTEICAPTNKGEAALTTGLVQIPCYRCEDTIEMQYEDFDKEAEELCARCGGER